ncbi:MAG: enoyl-CoA hydratase/isomerase family protein [Acidobacteriota bacterium]
MSEIEIADRGAVRTITLDRPESKNGVTVEIGRALVDAVRAPDAIRVLVLAGANGAFCSGLDLKDAMRRGIGGGAADGQALRETFHGLIRALVHGDRPAIAAVDGVAVGYGCDLALACDVRIVSERAQFGEVFVRRGLMPDGGGTFLLPRIVGVGRALELMYTGELVDADTAMRIGLANRVVPSGELAARAAELAERIAAGPPLAYAKIKRAVYASLDGDLDAALQREAEGQLELLGSRDFAEGLSAFLQKRAPRFQGR